MSLVAPSGKLTMIKREAARRASASLTHRSVLRRGDELGIWLGCGYPRSGTVWLCHLMATALELPYPQNYELPIAMRSVIHSHWRYDPRMPRTVYIIRDGRDVLTSLLYYVTRSGMLERNPVAARLGNARLLSDLSATDGPDEQLKRLFDRERTKPIGAPTDWAAHVREWRGRPNVAVVRFEDLVENPVPVLGAALAELGTSVAPAILDATARAHDFAARTGRAPGDEDPSSFRRSGTAGDWRRHFDRELAEMYDAYAGDLLVELGYEESRSWPDSVTV